MHPYTESELDTFLLLQTSTEVSHRSKNAQTRPYCALRIIFMGVGVAEVHQETIP
jgi:hypothetical protein